MFRSLRKKIISALFSSNREDLLLSNKYPQYQIGKGTYGHPKIHDWKQGTSITIGAYCSFAKSVIIFLGGEHRTDWVTTYPFNVFDDDAKHIKGHPHTKGDVAIGNDVWIATGATILSGVKIGNGAVIGTNAVVARDVEPYTIVAGNPARYIRHRFEPEIIKKLEAIQWWAWPDEKIKKALPLLLSDNINEFIKYAESLKV